MHAAEAGVKRTDHPADSGRKRSGTGNTIEYAVQKKKPVYIIHPETMEVKKIE